MKKVTEYLFGTVLPCFVKKWQKKYATLVIAYLKRSFEEDIGWKWEEKIDFYLFSRMKGIKMLEIMEDEGERWIEIVDDKLLGFLYNISNDVLKFVWKEKDIEILEKYFDENQSNYLDEFAESFFENIEDVDFDEIIYEVISETKKEWLTEKFLSQNKYRNFKHISIFTYPDEIRNLDDEILWKNPENFELYTINLVRN